MSAPGIHSANPGSSANSISRIAGDGFGDSTNGSSGHPQHSSSNPADVTQLIASHLNLKACQPQSSNATDSSAPGQDPLVLSMLSVMAPDKTPDRTIVPLPVDAAHDPFADPACSTPRTGTPPITCSPHPSDELSVSDTPLPPSSKKLGKARATSPPSTPPPATDNQDPLADGALPPSAAPPGRDVSRLSLHLSDLSRSEDASNAAAPDQPTQANDYSAVRKFTKLFKKRAARSAPVITQAQILASRPSTSWKSKIASPFKRNRAHVNANNAMRLKDKIFAYFKKGN